MLLHLGLLAWIAALAWRALVKFFEGSIFASVFRSSVRRASQRSPRRNAVEVLDDGAVRFIRPDGTAIDSVAQGCTQPLSDCTEIPQFHREHGIHIDAHTAVTRWRGEAMRLRLGRRGLAHEGAAGKSQAEQRVSAET